MRTSKIKIFLFLFLNNISLLLLAQKDYNTFYRNNDPARDNTDASVKKEIHLNFLNDALSSQDTLKIILGSMYLANDFVIESNYDSAMENLIRAGNYAIIIKDTLLLGRINHKKGAVYSLLQNYDDAIKFYEISIAESSVVKDSQYIAITLEQLGRRFANLKDYYKSNDYYQKAIPLVEKFCNPKSLTTTLINYGNSLSDQDSITKAIQVYKKAITIGEQIPDDYEIYPAKQNLALVYYKIDSLDEALELYQECKLVFAKNGWLDFLIYTYDGLSITFDKMGETDSALYYFKKFYFLKDSIIGTEVHSRINQLEKDNELQKKDLALLRQKETAYRQLQNTRNVIIGFILLFGLCALGLWLLSQKGKRTKLRLEENRQSLKQMIKLFELKNAELRDLKNQLKGSQEDSIKNINFYDINILTDSDWKTFMGTFEKSYPKYLQKMRMAFPDISVAEERLFIFIKLQLSTKETANILGVQPDSIKKTRTRLRKRLGLNIKESLNDFVQKF